MLNPIFSLYVAVTSCKKSIKVNASTKKKKKKSFESVLSLLAAVTSCKKSESSCTDFSQH